MKEATITSTVSTISPMDKIVADASKRSQWNLSWSISGDTMTIMQAGDDRSRVCITLRDGVLQDSYGRMSHYGLNEPLIYLKIKEEIEKSITPKAPPRAIIGQCISCRDDHVEVGMDGLCWPCTLAELDNY